MIIRRGTRVDLKGNKNHNRKVRKEESAEDAKQNVLKVFLSDLCGFSLRPLR
jgi:hypothetical protein